MPSEVCRCYCNSLFPESHSCCSAERAREEFVKLKPLWPLRKIYGILCLPPAPFSTPQLGPPRPTLHLVPSPSLPPNPPQHMPISLSPSVLLRRRKKESEGGFSSIRPFSTRLLEMTEIVSLMTHYTRVFSGTRCCRAFVPIEKCKKPPSWIDFQAPMKHVDLFRREILFDFLCLRGATNILCHSCSDVCGSETQAGRATTLESYTIHTHRHNEQYGMLWDSKGLLSLHF